MKKDEKGKRVAKQKKMRAAGEEVVAGHTAPKPAAKFVLNIKGMDKRHPRKPDYKVDTAGMTLSEIARMNGATFSKNPYKRPRPQSYFTLWNTKKELEEVKIAMTEFDNWLEVHKRKYAKGRRSEDKRERNNRFLVFLENKRRVDALNKVKPDYYPNGYNLENMDKLWWEEDDGYSRYMHGKAAPSKVV